MKKILILAAIAMALAVGTNAFSAAFTAGNLVVYRIGDGSTPLTNVGNRVFLVEYDTSGNWVQEVAMPTNYFGGNGPLVGANGSSEGFVTRSADGRFILVTGYAGTLGLTNAASLPSLSAITVPRVIGVVDGNGNINTTTLQTNSFASSETIRSATSTDGTNLWFSGDSSGLRYTTRGSYLATQLSAANTNLRALNIFSNQLYFSTASGSNYRIAIAGTEPPPTTNGTTYTSLPGFPTSGGSLYAFVLFNLTGGADKYDTLYVTDDSTNRLYKFSLVGGNWVTNGFVKSAIPLRGLTGKTEVSGGTTNVHLYVTRSPAPPSSGTYDTTGTYLLGYTDTTGWNAAPTGDGGNIEGITDFSTAPAADTTFRGVALAPVGGETFPSGPGQISVGPVLGLFSSGFAGCSITETDTYSVANIGTASVTWTATCDAAWVSFSPVAGSLSSGGSVTVSAFFNASVTGLSAGTNTATITFANTTSPPDNLGTTTRQVRLILIDRDISPNSGLNSGGQPGGPFTPTNKVYTLTNGGTAIDWTAHKVGNANWFDLSATSGSVGACAAITVTVSLNANANALAAGFYSDTIDFTNATANTLIDKRTVSLQVGTLYFCDDFSTFNTGNLVGQQGWTQLSTQSTRPIQVTNGQAWVTQITDAGTINDQDAYKNFVQSWNTTVFAGIVVTVTAAPPSSATSPSYFAAMYNVTNAGGFANYRFTARAADAGNTNFVFAGRTTGQAGAPWTYSTTPRQFDTECRVIIRTDPVGSNMWVYVNPVPGGLGAQTPEFTAIGGTGIGPATNVGSFVISQYKNDSAPMVGCGIAKVCISTNFDEVYNFITPSGPTDPFTTWQDYYWAGSGGSGDPNAAPGADPDGDGMSNTNEFLAGFNPTNHEASLRILDIRQSAAGGVNIKVTYLGADGDSNVGIGSRTNVLEYTAGSGSSGSYLNNFTSTGKTNILSGGNGSGFITNMVDVGGGTNRPARYYRIRVLAP